MKRIGVDPGEVKIIECEEPRITNNDPHRVLVKVKYSAISLGTEMGLIHNPHLSDWGRLPCMAFAHSGFSSVKACGLWASALLGIQY